MSTQNARKSAQTSAPRTQASRETITLERVATFAPTATQAEKMSVAFGLEPVDYPTIRETTETQVVLAANALVDNLSETAMRIHLQRVVGAFVGSAYGAAQFYHAKVTQARDLTTKLANEERDEDREGVHGFESKAARAREFAARAGLVAHAVNAAAEGAVHAYAAITGETWKPFEAPQAPAASVSRQSAAAEMDAFN
jgi:hypothetical protein